MFCMLFFPVPMDRSSTISFEEEDFDDIEDASLSGCDDFLIGTIHAMNLLLLLVCCCCCDVVSDLVGDMLRGDFFLVGNDSIRDVDADVVGSCSSTCWLNEKWLNSIVSIASLCFFVSTSMSAIIW